MHTSVIHQRKNCLNNFFRIDINNPLQRLSELESRGEDILGAVSICRKFQTEKEKILPWSSNYQDILNNLVPYEETEEVNILKYCFLRFLHIYYFSLLAIYLNWNYFGQE